MKKLLLAVLVIINFTACKKSEIVSQNAVEAKVKTFSIGSDIINYAYDNQGRIMARVSPSGNWKAEFAYSGNTVTENYYIGATLSTTKLYELNANGLVSKESYTFPATSVPYKTQYSYNANRQLLARISNNTINANTSIETFFYTGSVLDSMQTTFNQNTDIYRFVYEYYTDKANTLSNKNQGFLFLAERESMALKKQTSTFRTNGFINVQVDDFTYNFDTKGKITKRTITTVGSSGTSVNDVTYY